MSAWGVSIRRMGGIVGSSVLQATVPFAAGLPPSVEVLAPAAFLYFFGLPLYNDWDSCVAHSVSMLPAL